LVEEHGPLPVSRAASLVCQLLEALQYAHEHGFVHRDIKPRNLLVGTDPESSGKDVIKLADFGLARVYQSSPLSGLTAVSGRVLENAGQAKAEMHSGKCDWAFMAPERITAFRDCKPPVDQYSAGAVLYYLLTGYYVYDFPGRVTEQLTMILLEDPVPILHRRPDLLPGLAEVIHRSLSRDPKNRYPDVWTMRAALAEFAG